MSTHIILRVLGEERFIGDWPSDWSIAAIPPQYRLDEQKSLANGSTVLYLRPNYRSLRFWRDTLVMAMHRLIRR